MTLLSHSDRTTDVRPELTLGDSVALGDTDWRIWTTGLLRGAGFPASGLDQFAGPTAATAATEHLSGQATAQAFADAYDADYELSAAAMSEIARDERLQLAVAWQNPTFAQILDKIAEGASGSKHRRRAKVFAQYWQRYCAKSETIGFFGPASWISIDPGHDEWQFDPGQQLIERTRVCFEWWMINEVGEAFVRRPGARWWFPPMLRPDVALHAEETCVRVPGRGPIKINEFDASVLAQCDGRRHFHDIAVALAGRWPDLAGDELLSKIDKSLRQAERKRWLQWDANLPIHPEAEALLACRVAAVGDRELRADFEQSLSRLRAAKDAIARSQDSEQLITALDQLDVIFTEITGQSASRSGGQAYAGRTLCYSDAVRDCRLSVGSDFLDQVGRPLALVCDSASWFGRQLAENYERAVTALIAECERKSGGPVTLADIWTRALRLFWGDDPYPLTQTTTELADRWRTVLDLDHQLTDDTESRVRRRCEDLAVRAREQFAHPGTELPELSVHSPDLQIGAESVDAINRGDYTVVLGELHACLASMDMIFLNWTVPGPESIRDKINSAVGGPRVVPLFPSSWRRNTGRFVPASVGTGDQLVGFTKAPTADRTQVHATSEITFVRDADRYLARMADGELISICRLFAVPMSIVAADAFKIGLDADHSPRLTIDNLVVFRETWRLPAAGIDLGKSDRYSDYLAVRSWASARSLPDHVFAKFPDETKPVFVDLTSPILVLGFATLARAALENDAEASITLSEALPDLDQSWLADHSGARYVSELRLHLTRQTRPSAT